MFPCGLINKTQLSHQPDEWEQFLSPWGKAGQLLPADLSFCVSAPEKASGRTRAVRSRKGTSAIPSAAARTSPTLLS